MARYVVLHHVMPADQSRPTHWDLMLEVGDVLRTWTLPEQPRYGGSIVAQVLPDHRKAYLDYEGPVSEDRGTVTRWDSGTFTWESQSAGQLTVLLQGDRLQCRATLVQSGQDAHCWNVRFSDG